MSRLLETKGYVLRKLATDGHDDSRCALELIDVHDALVAELFEVELIGGIKVGRVRLGVVVDHDRLLAHLPERLRRADGAPIELDRAADAIHTAAQDDGAVVVKGDIERRSIVCREQVVRDGRELGGERVDLLDPRPDAELQTKGADFVRGAPDRRRILLIGEAHLLCLYDVVLLQAMETADGLELPGAVDDVLELVQEPLVNLCQFVDTIDRVVFVKHGLADRQPPPVARVLELKVKIGKLIALEADNSRVYLADCLLEGLLDRPANGHDFADRLHGASDISLDVLELGKVPTRDLGDDVIERGLEIGRCGLGDGIGEFWQAVAETNLGGRVGKRISGGLGCQSGRAGQASIDLDDPVVKAFGLQRVLDVALTHDSEVAHNLDGGTPEHVVLLVAERLAGGNNDRVARVDSQGVEVLHVADRDAVVIGVTDNLVLDLFPALERLLYQNLRRQGEGAGREIPELLLVVCEPGPKTAQGVGSTHDDGISNFLGGIQSLLNGTNGNRLGNGDVDLIQSASKEVAIFAELKRANARTQDANTVFLIQTHALHLDAEIQGGLAAKG